MFGSINHPPQHPRTRFIQAIQRLMEDDPTLLELEVRNEGINQGDEDDEEDSDVLLLAKALRNNTVIKMLDLSFNRLSSSGISTLVLEGLLYNHTVKRVNFSSNQIRVSGATALGQWLLSGTPLEVLILHQNEIGCEGAACLARGLKCNSCCVRELVLAKNKIGVRGAQALGTALRNNRSVVRLDLANNQITDEGMNAIASALGGEYDDDEGYEERYNNTLEVLQVDSNDIGPAGCSAFAVALRTNQSLKALRMMDNSISNSGLCCIAWGLMANTTLERLYVDGNSINCFDLNALPECLQVCGLETLCLNRNMIQDGSAVALALALESNTRLKVLNLRRNHIGIKGGVAIANVLEHCNMTVEELDMQYNRVTCTQTMTNPLKKIRYFTRLNRAGRRLLRCEVLHMSLWPLVLSKANYQADVRFYFLRECPDLVKLANAGSYTS